MKNFFANIKKKINSIAAALKCKAQATVQSATGEGYVDSGVKIIIAVVVGGVLLAGLYALFNTTIVPTLTSKISGMFSYSGT